MNTEKRSQNPYVGPRAFKEGEPLFGRGLEQLQLFQLLVARRIALLHSPSGAGKTSLIQAGLIPKLKADGFNVLPIARLNEKPPESPPPANGFNRYIYSLLLSLQERSEDRSNEKLLALSLSEYLEPYSSVDTDSELMVLIIDQFEEVLTADPTDIDQKIAFFTQVGRVLRKSNLWALFVIREDYLGALEPYVRAIPTRLSNTFRLDLLGTAAASDAIRKPAEIQGVQFADRAVEALVDDLRRIQVQQPDGKVVEQPGLYVEPVQLQVVCHRLWQELSPGQTEITEEDLKAVGNVDKSLAAYYADRVEAIEADLEISVRERDIRKWVHNKLITKDEIRVPVLKGQGQTEGLDNRVVSMLEDAHLIRTEERAGMTWYELAHDRLVKPVRDDNVKWFNKHLSLLQRQAQRWQEEGGPDYLLLRGQALERAEDWAELHPDKFSENDQAFLEASRKEHEREEEKRAAKIRELELQQQLTLAEEQRKRAEEAEARQKAEEARAEEAALRAEEAEAAKKRYRRLTWIALTMMAVALIAAILAGVLWNAANANYAMASKYATIAAIERDALATSNESSGVALAKFIAAYEQAIDSQATANSALATSDANPLEQANAEMAATSAAVAQSTASAFRTSANATATALAREVIVFEGHSDGVLSAVFSPDGERILTGSLDHTAMLWDAGSGQKLDTLAAHDGWIWAAVFSPDGEQILTASSDSTARLWDREGQLLSVLAGHTDRIWSAVFSPNGERILTASGDNTARLWDREGQLLTVLAGHTDRVWSADFSPDGERIVTASFDGTAQLWDVEGQPLAVLEGHTDRVTSADFSPDGERIITASSDNTARLWDVEGQLLAVLEGHTDVVESAAFSPDGERIVTASSDNTARLWDGEGRLLAVLVGHSAPVISAVFSPDGQRVLTASGGDITARLWDAETGQELVILAGHTGWVNSAIFSPDGERVLTASNDNTARLWKG